MQPSDRPADRDADPTTVRPDRQDPDDPSGDPDAAPTTVRPRHAAPEADATEPDGEHSGELPTSAAHRRDEEGEAVLTVAGPTTYAAPTHAALTQDVVAAGFGPVEQRWGPAPDRYPVAADDHPGVRLVGDLLDPAQDDPDGAPTTVLTVAHSSARPQKRDWAWVEEWRAERSAPAWGPGIAMGAFVALIVAVALIVLTSGVSDTPVLAVVFNVVIAAGMAPALWLCRALPVLRFLAAGAAAGIVLGWIAMLTTF